jgi:hypothetical protein
MDIAKGFYMLSLLDNVGIKTISTEYLLSVCNQIEVAQRIFPHRQRVLKELLKTEATVGYCSRKQL